MDDFPDKSLNIPDFNINVDFAEPLDYVEEEEEPSTEAKHEEQNEVVDVSCNRRISYIKSIKNTFKKVTGGFVPFSGKGYRLGSS